MGRSGTLVCAALEFGFGPASKLLALAPRLRRSFHTVFVGTGSALELVSRAPGSFDEVHAGRLEDPSFATWVAGAAGVLSLMDRGVGAVAARTGTPLHVVDSLLWLRREIPADLRGASSYWAQSFPGLDAERYAPRPTIVGPLVEPRAKVPLASRAGLVVHLGGSAAPDDRASLYAAYARLVLGAVLDAGLDRRYGRVTVIGGRGALDAMEPSSRGRDVARESPAPDAARTLMAKAALVLSPPGLTTALECFSDGTPLLFLPPQNFSQWRILDRFRAAGVAPDAFPWDEAGEIPVLPETLEEGSGDPRVRQAIESAASSPAARTGLAARLSDPVPAEDRIAAQSAFFGRLGENGLEAVAAGLGR